jgi:hypothetical protein
VADEHSDDLILPWRDDLHGDAADLFATPSTPAVPADGRFAGEYHDYIAIPEPLCAAVVERTEAELAAFGSYAAMGPHGSFELRRSDAPSASALALWSNVSVFYYAHARHLRPILEAMDIPIVPLKHDFLHAYERVITELGQI